MVSKVVRNWPTLAALGRGPAVWILKGLAYMNGEKVPTPSVRWADRQSVMSKFEVVLPYVDPLWKVPFFQPVTQENS